MTRWGVARKVPALRMSGGHYRFDADLIAALLARSEQPTDEGKTPDPGLKTLVRVLPLPPQ